VFSILVPLEQAIVMTALVHFSNNCLKLGLLTKHLDKQLLINFGLPALIGAIIGSMALTIMGQQQLFHTFLKQLIGFLMCFFALIEILNFSFKASSSHWFLGVGGLLSGFFGGFSGHQGALRSLFLSKLELDKFVFVATSTAISFCVDLSRISVYVQKGMLHFDSRLEVYLLITGVVAAFFGTFFGKRFLKKITLRWFQAVVACCLMAMGIAFMCNWV
jgi:uncharacterized membrane protein YfcA